MFRYVEFDKSDAEFLPITHAARIFSAADGNWPKPLLERAVSFLHVPGVGAVPEPDEVAIRQIAGGGQELIERPLMSLDVPVLTIRANSPDIARIAGIPPKTKVTVRRNGLIIDPIDQDVGGDVLEFEASAPGTYVIDFTCFPYRPCTVTIQVTE